MSAVIGDELREAIKKVRESVRARAKNAGAPLFYVENGRYIREEANGEKHVIYRYGNKKSCRIS